MLAGRYEASYWENYARRNCWQWEEEGPDDIIAYKPEDEPGVVVPQFPGSVQLKDGRVVG